MFLTNFLKNDPASDVFSLQIYKIYDCVPTVSVFIESFSRSKRGMQINFDLTCLEATPAKSANNLSPLLSRVCINTQCTCTSRSAAGAGDVHF